MWHVPRLPLRTAASLRCLPLSIGSRRWQTTPSKASKASSSLLEHRHLIGDEATGLTSYEAAEDAQEQHRARFLTWKGLPETSRTAEDCPRPLLLSFESTPTFTLGRRQEDLTAEQKAHLERPLDVHLLRHPEPISSVFHPLVKKTNRGGLTTYHGPGQLVLWPVLDMHSSLYPKYSVSTFASHLEATTQQFLSDLFDIKTYTNRDEPGVWVHAPSGQPRKIAALGVHHRRYVTALGTAINIDVAVKGTEEVNPWARFVPCGLEGKRATSVAAELGGAAQGRVFDLKGLARQWAAIFEEGLVDASRRGADLGR
ncbi:putative Lipoyltransferase [Trichoderma reesei RUT C-30]|uniref:Putative Lipoyltransferase n=2 Tax=Hypocrea jecorina TaxID=51453 RepID=A0A024S6R1_HYPJR|nr:putative Lipoyltransferase [Trichoderma reesei RUT C-30]